MAVSRRDGLAGQDGLRRVGEASVLILISLADGPKHGYALIQDIKELAGVELGSTASTSAASPQTTTSVPPDRS